MWILIHWIVLLTNYKDRSKIEKLISLGDMSCLGKNIELNSKHQHSFENRQKNGCVFYGRDRGETTTEPKKVKLEDIDSDSWIEYCYVYGKDNVWRYFETGHLIDGLKNLDIAIKENA